MRGKLKLIVAVAAVLTSGLMLRTSDVHAEKETNQTIIDFENTENNEGVLSGKYEGCNFGNMGWNVDTINGNTKLWADALTLKGQVNKIAIPYGKVFRGFKASCTDNAIVKIVSGAESNSFEIGSSEQTYTTDFINNEMAVYLIIDCQNGASDVKFDDIILEDVDISKQNVALKKPVATSGECESPAEYGNDGNTNTMWIHNGDGANQWWQVDLEGTYTLCNYEIEFEKEEDNPWKYKIEASVDGDTYDVIVDKTRNTDTSQKQMDSIESQEKYRYVRVTITGLPQETYWCGFREFKIFTEDIYSNVALGKITNQSEGINGSEMAVDGDINTFAGNTATYPYWWTVDLGESYDVKKIELVWEDLYEGETNIVEDWKYKIEYSNDHGSTWEKLVDYTEENPYTNPEESVIQGKEVDVQSNLFKVTITGCPTQRPYAWAILPEFRVFAVDNKIPEEEGQNLNIDIAYGQPVKASSTSDVCDADNVTDYNQDTIWSPTVDDNEQYLQINLDREYIIKSSKVEFESNPSAYKFLISSDGKEWTELAHVSANEAENRIQVKETVAKYVRFKFQDLAEGLSVQEVHFDGIDAGIKSGKRILVLAPHEDDEMLMAGGIINRAVEVGDEVKILLATNGDYNGEASGKGRIVESINALNALGVSKNDIMFLGYADTGGLGGAQTYEDSFLYKLYTANEKDVLVSRWGNQYTYGNSEIKNDYHYEMTGDHALYTRENFLSDLQMAISTYMPTDIYVPSRYDMHFDHAYLDLFAIEAIQNIQKENVTYNPTLHESIIHSCAGDSNWPIVNSDEKGIQALNMPTGLEDLTMFRWDERENVNVPYAMRQTPFAYNLKDQALRLYTSQYYDYIGSFAKVNEIFWTRDFSSFAKEAEITASSDKKNSDKKIDQSAIKAVDGIRDGFAVGLPYNHQRYPHAEWVTNGEKEGAWIDLKFRETKDISKVVLYDKPNMEDQILGGTLVFDDGSEIKVGELSNNGRPVEIEVNKASKSIKFVVTKVSESTTNTGLAEIEVY